MGHDNASNMRPERPDREVANVDLTARLLTVEGDVFYVRLVDLSHGGCRVDALLSCFEPGDPLAIELPGLTEFAVGRAAWCKDGAIGIQFETPLFEPVFRYLRDKLFNRDEAA